MACLLHGDVAYHDYRRAARRVPLVVERANHTLAERFHRRLEAAVRQRITRTWRIRELSDMSSASPRGSACCCSSSASRSWRSRSTSRSGKLGSRITSARSASAAGNRSAVTVMRTSRYPSLHRVQRRAETLEPFGELGTVTSFACPRRALARSATRHLLAPVGPPQRRRQPAQRR